MPPGLFISFLNVLGNISCPALSFRVVPQPICNCVRAFKRPNAYLRLRLSCHKSWRPLYYGGRPGSALLACAGRGLFCLSWSETLRAAYRCPNA